MSQDPLQIASLRKSLSFHPMYGEIQDLKKLKIFMETHVFAVWDFMSLLKALQRRLTCVEIPWKPAKVDKRLTRLINEIVLGEESDKDELGVVMDHYSLYLEAMNELGADTQKVSVFTDSLDFQLLRPAVADFVRFNLNLCFEGPVHEVAAAFLWGREKLIPDMFQGLLNKLEEQKVCSDKLRYYIQRHIDLDGGEHSHLAFECLEILCEGDEGKWQAAVAVGERSLSLRSKLWDDVITQFQEQQHLVVS